MDYVKKKQIIRYSKYSRNKPDGQSKIGYKDKKQILRWDDAIRCIYKFRKCICMKKHTAQKMYFVIS